MKSCTALYKMMHALVGDRKMQQYKGTPLSYGVFVGVSDYNALVFGTRNIKRVQEYLGLDHIKSTLLNDLACSTSF
jgi:hypothetical protein